MADILNGLGTALTSFIKALSEFWTWFNTPINLFFGEFAPIQLFGVGLIALMGYVIVRALLI